MKAFYKRLYLVVLISIGNCLFALSQDINFSQYNYAPFQTNPSFVGASGDASLIFNSRINDGNSGLQYNANTLSALYPLINAKNHRWAGVGLNFFGDKAGEAGLYRQLGASGSFDYNLRLSKLQTLSFGLQLGYFQKKISDDGFTTSSQWVNNYGFDASQNINEYFETTQRSYFNISSGLNWQILDRHGDQKGQLGIALFDLNKPNQSFFNEDRPLPIRYVVSGSLVAFQKLRFSIIPELFYVRDTKTNFLNIGPLFRYKFSARPFTPIGEGNITIGVKYASNNSFISLIQLHQPYFTVGFSYDNSFLPRNEFAKNRSTYEVLLIFKRPVRKKQKEFKTISDYSVGDVKRFYENESVEEQKESAPKSDNEQIDNDTSTASTKPVRFSLKREFKFKFNDTSIESEDDLIFMDDLVKLLNSNKKLKMEIIGHTDNVGTYKANLQVSENRAKAVLNHLVSKGIDKKRLKAVGKGAKEPIVPNDTEANKSKNRRVEFMISE